MTKFALILTLSLFGLYRTKEYEVNQKFSAADFTLDFNDVEQEDLESSGGSIRRATIKNLPALKDMSSSLQYLKPCSINLPHYHPRGSELIHVFENYYVFVFPI